MHDCNLRGKCGGNEHRVAIADYPHEGKPRPERFSGIDPGINPGYDQVEYEVEMESSADSAALKALHAQVQRTSPNYHNFARAIDLKAKLTILQ